MPTSAPLSAHESGKQSVQGVHRKADSILGNYYTF